MISLAITSGMDMTAYNYINAFVDLPNNTIYLIENKTDYNSLPQSIIDMLTASVVTLPDGIESNQFQELIK